MTTNQLLSGLAIYQLVAARLRYRVVWWLLFLFLVASGVLGYYAVSRLVIVWPIRLGKEFSKRLASLEIL
jgi:hypothetical protein